MSDVQPLRDTKTNNRSPVSEKAVSMTRVDIRYCAVPLADAAAQSMAGPEHTFMFSCSFTPFQP